MIKKKIATACMAVMMAAGSTVPAYAATPNVSSLSSWKDFWGSIGSSSGQVSLTAPQNVKAVNTECSIRRRTMKISWSAVKNAKKYIVQESISKDFNKVTEMEVTTAYLNRGFINGAAAPVFGPSRTTYYYRVKAVCGSSESAWSDVVTCAPTK